MPSHNVDVLSTVVYQFFAGLDRRDHQSSARLMARSGTWHRQDTEIVGPNAVLAALEKRDPKRQTGHLVTNLWIEQATETTVRLRYYLTAFETMTASDGTTSRPKMLGVRDCIDDLVLEEGQWRIGCKKSHLFLPAA